MCKYKMLFIYIKKIEFNLFTECMFTELRQLFLYLSSISGFGPMNKFLG